MKIAELILSTLHQPVLVLDGSLRPLIANPSFYQSFGFAPTDVKGKFIDEFVLGNTCEPPLRVALESIVTNNNEIEDLETVCTLWTGRRILFRVNARRIHTAELSGMILVEPRDVSKEKEAECRIQELNDALQKHVATVDAMNRELESYSHSVSHDLRTPLRFVNRIAHLLLHEPGAHLSSEATQQVNMILHATNEMGKLIERLLVFSQISRDPIRKHRVDLKQFFQEALKELEFAQENRNVEIVIQDLAPCEGDRTFLKEVVVNLLANALKFTRRCERAQITIGCTERNEETIYFVQDNGVGFDMNDSGFLFVPFQRLHNLSDFEGTGIGLALVKRIIERHEGRIWAESEVDHGTTFYFTLGKGSVE